MEEYKEIVELTRALLMKNYFSFWNVYTIQDEGLVCAMFRNV
jgi:hypothetical protein